jgi:hypothetical protein
MIYEQPAVYELHLIRTPTVLIIGQADRTVIGKNRVTREVTAELAITRGWPGSSAPCRSRSWPGWRMSSRLAPRGRGARKPWKSRFRQ